MTTSARRWLLLGALLSLAVGATAWLMVYDVASRDRRLQKSAAVDQCVATLRDAVRDQLRAAGLSAADSTRIADGARFTDVQGHPEPLSFDSADVPMRLGKPKSSVLTDWQIGGRVSLDASPPFGSQLGAHNWFTCSVVVFDDKTVYVAGRGVYRS